METDKAPIAPDHLSESEAQIFNEIAEKMHESGSLSTLDVYALENYSVQLCLFRRANSELQKTGEYIVNQTVKNNVQAPAPSPWIRILRDTSSALTVLSAKLGLTPTDRKRVSKSTSKKSFRAFETRFRTNGSNDQ